MQFCVSTIAEIPVFHTHPMFCSPSTDCSVSTFAYCKPAKQGAVEKKKKASMITLLFEKQNMPNKIDLFTYDN
jgi:hypothetical protein